MPYDIYLAHHGIKGQKWGVRRYQNYDGSHTPEGREREYLRKRRERATKRGDVKYATKDNPAPKNTKYLKDYSGPAYFISEKSDFKKLDPRVPDNYFTKNGHEDATTKRVSFAPTVSKCLAGLSQNVEGKTFYIYSPDDIKSYKVYKPNIKAVPDSKITDELWITEPVSLKPVGAIQVTGNKGKPGKIFSYGNQTAELYDDWTYERIGG